MDPELPQKKGRFRFFTNLLILLLVYVNIAVIFNPYHPPYLQAQGIPVPAVLYDALLYPHMFTSYTKVNFDHSIEGFTNAPGKPATWIKLNIEEHFPYGTGMRHLHMTACRILCMQGTNKQQVALKDLARQIRLRHNRLHPDKPVNKIRFGYEQWPKSPDGFQAGKLPGQISYVELYSEGKR